MIVVDASIAAKWYLNEPGSDEAATLLEEAAFLMAPALVRIEVTAAILRRYREGALSLERTQQACDLWEADLAAAALQMLPDAPLLASARSIALKIKHPLQDCLYLAAAVESKATRLVTADKTFHARAHQAFPFVELKGAQHN